MFHQHILTFMQVAEQKSFSAAAEKLFLTPNAVKKRIETLEHETDLRLFQRTNQGCALTQAGISLYRDLLEINKLYEEAIANATYAQIHSSDILFIGIMSTFAEAFMTNTWHNVRQKLTHQQIQIHHYGSTFSEMEAMFKKVGTATAICVDIYDADLAKKYKLSVRKISSFPLYVGIPCNIEFHGEQPIPLEALSGYSIALPPKGRAKVFDMLHKELLQKVPDFKIEAIEEYTIRSMNECSMKQQFVLITQNQIAHYPFFAFAPLDTAQMVDFGVYYKKHDEKRLSDFLQKITIED